MDIPTLQQVSSENFVTRLDFRSKFVLAAAISIVAFIWEDPFLGSLLAIGSLLTAMLSGVSKQFLLLILKVMFPFFLMILVIHGFLNKDHLQALTAQDELTPIFTIPENIWIFGGGVLSHEGWLYSLNILFKSITLIVVVAIAIFTTAPQDLIVSIAKSRVPYKVAFAFSSTLRFFPVLFNDIQAIIEAQRLRGIRFEKMGFFRRARVFAKLAVPLNLNALFKAQQVEVVLQAKGFSGSSDRTYLHDRHLGLADWSIIVVSISGMILAAFLYFYADFGKF